MADDLTPSDLTPNTNTARAGGATAGRRGKSRLPGLSEAQLQKAVARYLDFALPPGEALWFHVPNGGLRNLRVAQQLRAEGVKPGVADCIVIWRGRVLAIELKAEKGRVSDAQRQWADQFTLAGGAYFVARSVDQVEEFLDAAGVPLRARHKTAAGRSPAE